MSAFADELNKWGEQNEQILRDAFAYATEEVTRSIVEGSELTGAPGQPVITGLLHDSWIPDPSPKESGATEWSIGTDNPYAEFIEDGANDRAFFDPSRQNGSLTNRRERSPVGGYHSVKLTESSFDRILAFAVEKAVEEYTAP